MSVLDLAAEPATLKVEMKEYAESILQSIEKDDLSSAVGTIQTANETHFHELYLEVGKLTRALHESIKNFKIDDEKLSEIENASDHLAYVVTMTEDAANKTMDSIEEALPIAEQNVENSLVINNKWQSFLNKELDAEEFRSLCKEVSEYLDQSSVGAKNINSHLNEVLMAQSFQDLTGQAIQKVTALIKDVEQQLVHLVAMASKIDQMTGIQHEEIDEKVVAEAANDIKAEGPQINKDAEGVVANQDDVDDLLSSLGF